MEHALQRAGKVIFLDPTHGRPTARVIRLTRDAIDRRLSAAPANSGELDPAVVQVDEEALMVAVGRQIRQRRTALGMSQHDLAVMLDCDRSAVCRWETGQRAPTLGRSPLQ